MDKREGRKVKLAVKEGLLKIFKRKSVPISFIMGTKGNKLDGVVKAVRTICAEDNGIVSPLSAG